MIKIKRRIGMVMLAMILSVGTLLSSGAGLSPTIVQAASTSSATVQANNAVQSLESSLKRNYLGSKNLPSFNSYLKKAKELTNKLPNGSTKTSLNNRIAETERIIRATESVVVLETSLEKNYHGVKNLGTFNAYIDRANKSIALVKTTVCKSKLTDRTYLAFNTVRDIEVVNTSEYKAAANDFVEARKLYRSASKEQSLESKNKALETVNNSLSLAWKIKTSVAKDYLVKDIKALISDINKIEVKEPVKEEKPSVEEKEAESTVKSTEDKALSESVEKNKDNNNEDSTVKSDENTVKNDDSTEKADNSVKNDNLNQNNTENN